MIIELKDKEMAKFRTRLKEIREAKHLTRMDVVRGANLSYPTVSKLEKEELSSIEAATVEALTRFLSCKYEDLVYLVESEKKPDEGEPEE